MQRAQKSKAAMKNHILDTPKVRTITFLLILWLVGITMAFWLGLGWLFLIETIRRFMIATPIIYLAFLRIVVSPQRAVEEKQLLTQKKVRMLYVWRFVVALIWLALTIFVFVYLNIRLADLLM
jgi:hypothetical protein